MTDGWSPAPKQRSKPRLNKNGGLCGVVRLSINIHSHSQAMFRIAEDLIHALGWEPDDSIAIYFGSGSHAGKVRMVRADDAAVDARTARLVKLKTSRSMNVSFPSRLIVGMPEAFEVLTVPHEIECGGLNVDLSEILVHDNAD